MRLSDVCRTDAPLPNCGETVSELSGLALRKAACEALGWRYQFQMMAWRDRDTIEEVGFYHSPKCILGEPCNFPSHQTLESLPAVESDPAVAWPLFLGWMKKNQYRADISVRSDGETCVDISRDDLMEPRVVMQFGSTPCEAIARAIAAGKKT